MGSVRVERRPEAIVGANIVGYLHLSEMDEGQTLAAILVAIYAAERWRICLPSFARTF
jgi:hypothetical protein